MQLLERRQQGWVGLKHFGHPPLQLQRLAIRGKKRMIAAIRLAEMAHRVLAAMGDGGRSTIVAGVRKHQAMARAGASDRQTPATAIVRLLISGQAQRAPLLAAAPPGPMEDPQWPNPLSWTDDLKVLEQDALKRSQCRLINATSIDSGATAELGQEQRRSHGVDVAIPNLQSWPHRVAEGVKLSGVAARDPC